MIVRGLFLLVLPFTALQQPATPVPWMAPPEADAYQDPLAADTKATVRGEKVFTQPR